VGIIGSGDGEERVEDESRSSPGNCTDGPGTGLRGKSSAGCTWPMSSTELSPVLIEVPPVVGELEVRSTTVVTGLILMTGEPRSLMRPCPRLIITFCKSESVWAKLASIRDILLVRVRFN
jgi:hypothetical protein